MGIQLSLTDSSPLSTGITSAILHMSGKVAVIRDLLHIIVSGILMVLQTFTKISEILSGSTTLSILDSFYQHIDLCIMCKSKSNNFFVCFCQLFKAVSIVTS